MKYFCNIRVISLATILLLLLAVVAMSRRPVPAVSGAQSVKAYVLTAGNGATIKTTPYTQPVAS
jgi:hypothetical protein